MAVAHTNTNTKNRTVRRLATFFLCLAGIIVLIFMLWFSFLCNSMAHIDKWRSVQPISWKLITTYRCTVYTWSYIMSTMHQEKHVNVWRTTDIGNFIRTNIRIYEKCIMVSRVFIDSINWIHVIHLSSIHYSHYCARLINYIQIHKFWWTNLRKSLWMHDIQIFFY